MAAERQPESNAWFDQRPLQWRLRAIEWVRQHRQDPRLANHVPGLGAGSDAFVAWLLVCKRVCTKATGGFGIFQIADWRWADAFADGYSPGDAVREALEADDIFAALFRRRPNDPN